MSKDQDSGEERQGFRDFQKHCKECRHGEPCAKYHVYVMSVHKSILESRKKKEKLMAVNPDYIEGSEIFYVGKTEHHPRCRQSQHKNYKKDSNNKWTCYCQRSAGLNKFKGFIHQPSTFVKGHTSCFLKPKLYRDRNPLPTSAAAEEAEKKLAADLRKQGFAVWAGHHDAETLKQQKKAKKPSKKAGN